MIYEEIAPPPPLDALVHRFWFLRGSLDAGSPQTIVPDGRSEIVLHLAEPFAEPDRSGFARAQPWALFAGQLTGPLHLIPRGPADVVGIRFHPAGARSLARRPLSEVTGHMVSLEEMVPGLAGALASAVARIGGTGARGVALAEVLTRFVRSEPSPLVTAAVGALGDRRLTRIESLSRALGVAPRTLERRIRETVGLSPATLRSVLRFRRVFSGLSARARGHWTRVAAAAGYYDQAHLIRDFRRFAGAPPSTFFGAAADLARAFVGPGESPA